MEIPKVIVLATSKGGAGKSTLARSLAAHWHLGGYKPFLIDADPQQTIVNRHDSNGPLGSLPVVSEPEETVGNVIQEKLEEGYRPVIVDTAGFRNKTTIRALVEADVAVIPVKASGEDAEVAVSTYDLIQEINQTPERKDKPIKACLVLTMTVNGTVISKWAREQLSEAGYPLLTAEMVHRVAYPESGLRGLSPCNDDPDGAAARDIAAIANEIMKL